MVREGERGIMEVVIYCIMFWDVVLIVDEVFFMLIYMMVGFVWILVSDWLRC